MAEPRISPQSTLEFLVTLDPTFQSEWDSEEPDPGEFTHHQVIQSFAVHLGRSHRSYTEKQLRGLGAWLSEAVDRGGEIENAVSTCLLEHLRQLKLNRVLGPFLSRAAKERTHA
jgi:hypothetical protein